MRQELIERAQDFNIILDDVSITELSFGKEYTAAVEAKQVKRLKIVQQVKKRDSFFVGTTLFTTSVEQWQLEWTLSNVHSMCPSRDTCLCKSSPFGET